MYIYYYMPIMHFFFLQEDEESILQGEKEAEKMIVEAYAALLLAFLSMERLIYFLFPEYIFFKHRNLFSHELFFFVFANYQQERTQHHCRMPS